MAGHYKDEDLDMIIDSHGMPVKDKVWKLLSYVLKKINCPVIIERDNNIPPYKTLEKEYHKLEKIVKKAHHESV